MTNAQSKLHFLSAIQACMERWIIEERLQLATRIGRAINWFLKKPRNLWFTQRWILSRSGLTKVQLEDLPKRTSLRCCPVDGTSNLLRARKYA